MCAGVILLLIGVLLHKTSEGFAMGVNLIRHNLPLRKWITLVSIFAFMAPLGVGIGMAVNEVCASFSSHHTNLLYV